jgi:hypothetical protein
MIECTDDSSDTTEHMRDRIIAEIKRLASENGGNPPGRKTFLNETGIREIDWRGRFWVKWGDAIKEAGFEPNSLTPKIPDDELFSKVAEAFRHYGKVPTQAEFKMYRNIDAAFPASIMDKRFPTKAELIASLREWATEAGGYDDVLAMLPAPSPAPTERPTRGAAKDGFVYLLRSGAHYKIGKSDEIERRIKEIKVALPEATTLEHTITTDDPSGIEAYWHRRFADRRMNGEWFKLTPADILAFKRRKFQ